jgi:hypothetical protein
VVAHGGCTNTRHGALCAKAPTEYIPCLMRLSVRVRAAVFAATASCRGPTINAAADEWLTVTADGVCLYARRGLCRAGKARLSAGFAPRTSAEVWADQVLRTIMLPSEEP